MQSQTEQGNNRKWSWGDENLCNIKRSPTDKEMSQTSLKQKKKVSEKNALGPSKGA